MTQCDTCGGAVPNIAPNGVCPACNLERLAAGRQNAVVRAMATLEAEEQRQQRCNRYFVIGASTAFVFGLGIMLALGAGEPVSLLALPLLGGGAGWVLGHERLRRRWRRAIATSLTVAVAAWGIGMIWITTAKRFGAEQRRWEASYVQDVKAKARELTPCLSNSDRHGLELFWDIDARGAITNIAFHGDDISETESACVKERVMRWRAPTPPGNVERRLLGSFELAGDDNDKVRYIGGGWVRDRS